MDTILITGVSGFIGEHISAYLSQKGIKILGLCHKNRAFSKCVCIFKQIDDVSSSWIDDNGLSVIINCAALSKTADCETDQSLAFYVNRDLPKHLALACSRSERKPLLLHLSSDLVFDGSEAPINGFCENCEAIPKTIYGKSKASGEEAVLECYSRSVVCRLSLVYGPKIGNASSFLEWILPNLIENRRVSLFYDEFRTPIYVNDLSELFYKLTYYDKKNILFPRMRIAGLCKRVIHVPGPERISRYDFGIILCSTFGLDERLITHTSLKDIAHKTHRPKDVSLNGELTRIFTSFSPSSIRSSLENLKESYKRPK